MKVLVDKVDEYRGNEDALRNAVFSAQKLGSSIEQDAKTRANAVLEDANTRAAAILNDARAEAARVTEGISAEVQAEETRLEETRKISAEFIDRMDQICRRQLEFLQRVGEMDFMRQHRSVKADQSAPAQPAVQPPAQRPTPPAPAAAPVQDSAPEIHETVKTIEETVAKVMDEPVISMRPDVHTSVVEDERPTKPFNIITDPEDDIEKSTQFSLDDYSK